MPALDAIGGLVGVAGVVAAAVAVFLAGPRPLVRIARALAVLGLALAAAGWVQALVASGFRLEPGGGGGMGHGSLLAAAGMLLLTFGAARAAERRRVARDRARFLAEERERRAASER